MALKQLLKRSQLAAAQAEASKHKEQRAALDERRNSLKKRETAASAALEELTADSTAEERKAVEDEIAAIEAETETLTSDETAHDTEQARLDGIVAGLEDEIKELDERSAPPAQKTGKPAEERKDERKMYFRLKKFGLDNERSAAFLADEGLKGFLARMREFKGQTRSITAGELTIPDVMLSTMRDNLHRYSKLVKHVDLKHIRGTARQNVLGAIPEAIWMEISGSLNELSFGFNQVEFDGYMVGGFIPVADSLLEDSDENLAAEVLDMLGQAIGLALDKAILYGTGTKMPWGILPVLALTAKPATWGTYDTFKNVSATNILKVSAANLNDVNFFKELVAACGKAKANYSNGAKFWAMNSATHAKLLGKAIVFNAAGAIVSSVNNEMPVVGGAIEILDFMPDDVIVGGYGSLYKLVERSGATLKSSEHVRFLQNQTLFKGVARYDGRPVISEGFIAFSLTTTAPSPTAVTFAEDAANQAAIGD